MTNPTSYTDEHIEICAKAIYEHWQFAAQCSWVEGGNSKKQDEARAYARSALSAIKSVFANRQRLRERLQVRVMELHAERNKSDFLIKNLVAIHALLYPPQMSLEDGRVMAFRPPNIDPHELLQRLSDEIRAIPDAIDAARATHNETKET